MTLSSQQLATGLWRSLQSDDADAKAITKAFLDMMEEQGLLALLPNVVTHLEFLQQQHRQQHTLTISVARPQSKALIKELTTAIGTQGAVVVEEDPALIGGFVAYYNNKVYDGRVATQLRRAEQVLLS